MNLVNHNLFDWLCVIVSVIALAFISLTMLLRGNDYRRKATMSRVATIRISGFVLAGFTPWVIAPLWLITGHPPLTFLTFFLVGVAMIFFTTENLPPWWAWLTKGDAKERDNDDAR